MNFKPRTEDLNNIAIVVVGYNRLKELKRLLSSLQNAIYDSSCPLVISIDASGNSELYDYVQAFEWQHGNKYVNIQEQRLGLREHIFQCGDLTDYFKGVIILEDDLFVSPYFYQYAQETLGYYQDDDLIAGISLYAPSVNSFTQLPFVPLQNGASVYAYQDVASWGEMYNKRMWKNFRRWLNEWNQDFDSIDMPNAIKTWEKAWSKFFYAYITSTGRYFLYPYISLTTNFNDSQGEHGEGGNPWTQSSLLMGRIKYQLLPSGELVKYDVYCHNERIYDWLNIEKTELTIDFFGMKSSITSTPYILTTSILPYHTIQSFALSMRPIELNIKYGVKGAGIYLYDTRIHNNQKIINYPYQYLEYMTQGFHPRRLVEYTKAIVIKRLKGIVKLK